jgi:hypothetical protein
VSIRRILGIPLIVLYVRNDPVNQIDPDGRIDIPFYAGYIFNLYRALGLVDGEFFRGFLLSIIPASIPLESRHISRMCPVDGMEMDCSIAMGWIRSGFAPDS